jgi:Bax protein
LNANTIEQLFKNTNNDLKEIRKTKLVNIDNSIDRLPKQIVNIKNVKERKKLFIQIVLPLIIEENIKIRLDRKKLFSILNKNNNSTLEKKWLDNKFKHYGVKNNDLSDLKIRMDEIPVSLAIAQAANETGWGTSRFALEGNALFGQWTYNGEGIKPAGADSNTKHKVMKFKILKASVRAYFGNLNTHSSYREFRKFRATARGNNEKLNSLILVDYLTAYAGTGTKYPKILKQIIKQNSLTEFDDVNILTTSSKLRGLI